MNFEKAVLAITQDAGLVEALARHLKHHVHHVEDLAGYEAACSAHSVHAIILDGLMGVDTWESVIAGQPGALFYLGSPNDAPRWVMRAGAEFVSRNTARLYVAQRLQEISKVSSESEGLLSPPSTGKGPAGAADTQSARGGASFPTRSSSRHVVHQMRREFCENMDRVLDQFESDFQDESALEVAQVLFESAEILGLEEISELAGRLAEAARSSKLPALGHQLIENLRSAARKTGHRPANGALRVGLITRDVGIRKRWMEYSHPRISLSFHSGLGPLLKAGAAHPNILLIHMEVGDDLDELVGAIKRYRICRTCEVILLCDQGVELGELERIGLQANAILGAETSHEEVVAALLALRPASTRPALMIIEDDPTTESAIRSILKDRSVDVYFVREPGNFLHERERLNPDMILMSIDLESHSSFDLCRLARRSPKDYDTPIVLTGHHLTRTYREHAFAVGGDAVVDKPFLADELTRLIDVHVERHRLRRRYVNEDLLSGLVSGEAISQSLGYALSHARLQKRWTSVLVFEIDDSEVLLERYGEDAVLVLVRSLADQLRAIFEPQDLLFRRTDGRFYVISRVSLQDRAYADHVMERLQRLSSVTYRSADGRGFYATLCGGHILIPPGAHEVADCLKKTDQVLAAARSMGTGRILTAELDTSRPVE